MKRHRTTFIALIAIGLISAFVWPFFVGALCGFFPTGGFSVLVAVSALLAALAVTLLVASRLFFRRP